MRLGRWDIRRIKQQILDDLYEKTEKEFAKRQQAIVRKNREYYFEPIQYLLDQLPSEILSRHDRYRVKICYLPKGTTTNTEDELNVVNEVWELNLQDYDLNPVSLSRFGGYTPAETKLDSRLYPETATLCNEMIALKQEKQEMAEFLITTTNQYSGTLQLRKIWPESLHKYLPAEPIKQAKLNKQKKKAAKATTPAVPDHLKNRLTTNLLEGN